MAGGLTATGFNRSSLQELISELEKDFQDGFSNPQISVEDNENLGQLIKIFSNRENLVWQAMEQSYNSQTINGAEGPYLDEIFARNGIFRENATSGSGFAVVETNSSAIDSTQIVAGTLFNGENGVQYSSPSSVPVSQRVTAYKLDATSIALGSYTLTVKNRVTDVTFNDTFNLSSGATTARQTFIDNIRTFLQSVNPSETNIYESASGLILSWGFDSAFKLRGLEQSVDFQSSPSLGNRYTLVEAVATTTGLNPLQAEQIVSMSILPTGYVSVTNINPFSSGTDVETDAAFVERARTVSNNPRSATRPAIVSGLLQNVAGIEKVKFDKVINSGVVGVTPIVIGGEIADIANELYRTQPINNSYLGTIATDVSTEDGETESIRFTRGVSQALNIRVTYSTDINTPLTETETNTAITNLTDFSEQWQLGETIFNFQLLSAVSSAQGNLGRFKSLLVEVKKEGDPDTSYSNADYVAASNELPTLKSEDIQFVHNIV